MKGGNRKEEPCHTVTVNLKCQVGVGIRARGFKSIAALTEQAKGKSQSLPFHRYPS